jgi:hypothetical protein
VTTVDNKPDLAELARAKLSPHVLRTAELDRLAGLLHPSERVVTLCDALCRSDCREWSGLTVLTDERIICLYTGSSDEPPPEFLVSAISSVEVGPAQGAGDARRGDVALVVHDAEAQLARDRPWERAEDIAQHIEAAIAARH